VSEDATPRMHATTILMVRKGGRVVIGGDGLPQAHLTVAASPRAA
jgi:ATP-dependent protease HslVU (ClpYQ) peptidase subunit